MTVAVGDTAATPAFVGCVGIANTGVSVGSGVRVAVTVAVAVGV